MSLEFATLLSRSSSSYLRRKTTGFPPFSFQLPIWVFKKETACFVESSVNLLLLLQFKMATLHDLKKMDNLPQIEMQTFSFLTPFRLVIYGVCVFLDS